MTQGIHAIHRSYTIGGKTTFEILCCFHPTSLSYLSGFSFWAATRLGGPGLDYPEQHARFAATVAEFESRLVALVESARHLARLPWPLNQHSGPMLLTTLEPLLLTMQPFIGTV